MFRLLRLADRPVVGSRQPWVSTSGMSDSYIVRFPCQTKVGRLHDSQSSSVGSVRPSHRRSNFVEVRSAISMARWFPARRTLRMCPGSWRGHFFIAVWSEEFVDGEGGGQLLEGPALASPRRRVHFVAAGSIGRRCVNTAKMPGRLVGSNAFRRCESVGARRITDAVSSGFIDRRQGPGALIDGPTREALQDLTSPP